VKKVFQEFCDTHKGKFDFVKPLGESTNLLKTVKSNQLFVFKCLISKKDYTGSIEIFRNRMNKAISLCPNRVIEPEEIGELNKEFYKIYTYHNHSLKDLISRNQYTALDAIKLIIEILDTVEILHSGNIIHGNIKPSNIFLNDYGKILLNDFAFEKTGEPSIYHDPNIVSKVPNIYSDIYSIGMIFYELLSWDKNIKTIIPELHIPGNLFTVIEKACLLKKDDRFKNIAAFKENLLLSYKPVLNTSHLKGFFLKQSKEEDKKKTKRSTSKQLAFYGLLYLIAIIVIIYMYFRNY